VHAVIQAAVIGTSQEATVVTGVTRATGVTKATGATRETGATRVTGATRATGDRTTKVVAIGMAK